MGRRGGGQGLAGKEPCNLFVFPAVVWATRRCHPDVGVHALAENSGRVGDSRAAAAPSLLSVGHDGWEVSDSEGAFNQPIEGAAS
eukprot:2060295-Alexandrium_andersonii.AAC.2